MNRKRYFDENNIKIIVGIATIIITHGFKIATIIALFMIVKQLNLLVGLFYL